MEKLDSAKNPVNIVILDACRNNPFGTRLRPARRAWRRSTPRPGL